MNVTLRKERVLLGDAYRLRNNYEEHEDNPKKLKDLTGAPLWKKRCNVKQCDDCTTKFPTNLFNRGIEKIKTDRPNKSRCLLCGNVLCKACVKHIPHYIFNLTEGQKHIDIDACGTCIVKVEEQYREKEQTKTLEETIMKVKEQLQIWNATWDKYITMQKSQSQYSRTEIEEIHKEMCKGIDAITHCKLELTIDWHEDNEVITTETYDEIIRMCDEIINREGELNLIPNQDNDTKEKNFRPKESSKKKGESCCRSCIRKCLCCFGFNKDDNERELEYKIQETDENSEAVPMETNRV